LKGLIENHAKLTNSKVAKSILKNWEKHQADFIKVMPRDYKAVLERKKKMVEKEGVLR
jgi:glutamate synthase (NADPH/NADH) large chain